MANWDDDDFEFAAPSVPVVASKGKWEGEDEDDSDVPVPPPLARRLADGDYRMNGTPSQKTTSPRLQRHLPPRSRKEVSSKPSRKEKNGRNRRLLNALLEGYLNPRSNLMGTNLVSRKSI